MAKFVDVYSKKTGKKHKVPPHFVDNPRLMAPFTRTPSQRAADQTPPPPPPADTNSDAAPAAPGIHRTTETPSAGDKE